LATPAPYHGGRLPQQAQNICSLSRYLKNIFGFQSFLKSCRCNTFTIQAFGYDTLIENAKKRNQAFFSVLLGE
jgi:hypothetical protein